MSNNMHSERISTRYKLRHVFLVRAATITIGCFGILWGLFELPRFWRESTVETISDRIVAGDEFKPETLYQQLPILESIENSASCRPAALRSAAIIRLRIFERLKDSQERSREQPKVAEVIRNSLSCAPADAFLWLALYSLGVNELGRDPEVFNALRLSYRVGPHEGWIAIKRSRIAFASFRELPVDLREAAINEFSELVQDSAFYGAAAEILIGPGWPERDLILPHLAQLSESRRARFFAALSERGYVLVPGVGLEPADSHRFAPQIRVPQ